MPTTHSTRDYIESALDQIKLNWSKPQSSARKSGNFGVLALDVFDVFDVKILEVPAATGKLQDTACSCLLQKVVVTFVLFQVVSKQRQHAWWMICMVVISFVT
eukprot:symbB.v1.2.036775.t1/scaffold5270.1/size29095/4